MDDLAQRLWVLERSDDASNAGDSDVCHFLGAIAILRPQSVAITFVRSAELRRAGDAALRAGLLRFDLDRDAANFDTLDEAIVWASTVKAERLARGWHEIQDVQDRLPASPGLSSPQPLADPRTRSPL
jgi:hypothetical protein